MYMKGIYLYLIKTTMISYSSIFKNSIKKNLLRITYQHDQNNTKQILS